LSVLFVTYSRSGMDAEVKS